MNELPGGSDGKEFAFTNPKEMVNLLQCKRTWFRSLGWEDPLEKGMATHFSILSWKIPSTEEPGGLQFMGLQRVRHN